MVLLMFPPPFGPQLQPEPDWLLDIHQPARSAPRSWPADDIWPNKQHLRLNEGKVCTCERSCPVQARTPEDTLHSLQAAKSTACNTVGWAGIRALAADRENGTRRALGGAADREVQAGGRTGDVCCCFCAGVTPLAGDGTALIGIVRTRRSRSRDRRSSRGSRDDPAAVEAQAQALALLQQQQLQKQLLQQQLLLQQQVRDLFYIRGLHKLHASVQVDALVMLASSPGCCGAANQNYAGAVLLQCAPMQSCRDPPPCESAARRCRAARR